MRDVGAQAGRARRRAAEHRCTVTAVGEVTLAVLAKPAFREALQDVPIRENVFLGMARRLHELDAGT